MIWNQLKIFFDLRGDIASTQEITKRVNAGIRFRGTNLSVLILAIFIASIGLNMNSTAVIIGAMLISPLMGSILGIGYGLARYDSTYIRSGAGNLFAQVLISVATSTLYFSSHRLMPPLRSCLHGHRRPSGMFCCCLWRIGRNHRRNTQRGRECHPRCCDCDSSDASSLHRRIWHRHGCDGVYRGRTLSVLHQ